MDAEFGVLGFSYLVLLWRDWFELLHLLLQFYKLGVWGMKNVALFLEN